MTSTRPLTLVLVDSTVNNYQSLVTNLRSEAEVIVLNPNQDGVVQITEALSDRDSIESLHILSHGDSGRLFLGSTQLSAANLNDYTEQLQDWNSALATDANILLYGCEVAAGESGQAFVQKLSQLTQADIAASTDLTGSAALGGDWELEYVTGDIHTPLAFTDEALEAYSSVLGILLEESFRNSDVADKSYRVEVGTVGGVQSAQPFLTARPDGAAPTGGLAGNSGTVDPNGEGALRLTSNAGNQSAFVLYDKPISAADGLSITFDFFSYNGSTGADGISFFLVDAAETRPITAGGFGGSLGYANTVGATGIEGGYIGIGFDEFGNFSNATETRVGGPGRTVDSIAVRGSEAEDYKYLTGTGSLTPDSIDFDTATTRTQAGVKKTAKVDITPNGRLSIQIDLNGDGDFTDTNEAPTELQNYDLVTNNGAVPTNFKFGFASSTGAFTNIHEIRNLSIATNRTGLVYTGAGVLTNPTTGAVSLTTAEGGLPRTVNVALNSKPTANVTVSYASSDPTEGTLSPASLTFTPDNWFTPQALTITPQDDTLTDGDITYPITPTLTTTDANYTALTPTAVSVTNTDNEGGAVNAPPVVPTVQPLALDPGGTVTIPGLTATDSDGVGFYTVTTVPPASQGTLFLGNPAQGGTQVTVNQTLTPAQIGNLFFRAGTDFTGTQFTYTATDNRGATSSPRVVAFEGVCVQGTRVNGSNGNNRLNGTDRVSDIIFGRGGNDRIDGRGCNDLLDGGAGNDTLTGGTGRDTLRGRIGTDTLSGGAGTDILNGGLGNDRLDGGEGDDILKGRRGTDLLIGGTGNDTMSGGLRDDRLRGGAGDDIVDGGRGNDFVKGGAGDDVLTGRTGRDTLLGFGGNDRISGGIAADVIVGGAGVDTLTGNRGRDIFEYRSLQDGTDVISDFAANRDRIDVSRISGGRSFSDFVRLSQANGGTLVQVASGSGFVDLATLTGASGLTANNFIV
jgi:Ca2+-binding RTX toxin-like protein